MSLLTLLINFLKNITERKPLNGSVNERKKEKENKKERYAPLLCASIWVVELTVTLQMGQCRCCLVFLESFSAGVSPVGLSCWAAVSLVAPVGSSRPSGFWKWGEETDRSADDTSDIGVRTTELEWGSSTLATGSESQAAAKETEKMSESDCCSPSHQLYRTTGVFLDIWVSIKGIVILTHVILNLYDLQNRS